MIKQILNFFGFNKAPVPGPKRISVSPVGRRTYQAAKASRLTDGFGQSTSSADSELKNALTNLRNRSRDLVRNSSYAKRAKMIVVNNVVGSGIGLQAQVMNSRGKLNQRINREIEKAWKNWSRAENCHVGGRFDFSYFERAAMGQIFEAGEVFIRKYFRPFGSSSIPLSLELVEAERVPHELQPFGVSEFARFKMGIERDSFGRPVAYVLRTNHPGDVPTPGTAFERVDASLIYHLGVGDRWPAARFEPWLHTTARKLNDMDAYTEAEIIAARGAASYMATIESDDDFDDDEEIAGGREFTIEPNTVERLKKGEKLNFVNPSRPNSQVDPFFRLMLREAAAGVGTSYESLSRDYSQSNYSSSRLALLDDRDLWRVLQGWFIMAFRETLHRDWMQQAVFSNSIPGISVDEYARDMEKFNAVRFKPRGWGWVDPTKEVQAYKEAVRCGFTTVSQVISLTGNGMDIEDLVAERKREIELFDEAGLSFDTDVKQGKPETAPKPEPSADAEDGSEAEDEGADTGQGEVKEAEFILKSFTGGNGHA